jgi:hypothetical protein
MDLASIASELASIKTQTNKIYRDAARNLLPGQQKTRSYKSLETVKQSQQRLNITISRYMFGEDRGEWKMQYYVQFPLGPVGAEMRKNAVSEQYESFALDYLKSRTDSKDLKYLSIERADATKIIYIFEVDKWLNDNFNSARPKFILPATLAFRFKVPIPRFLSTEAPRNDLSNFIGTQFKLWLKNKPTKLQDPSLKFLKKMSPDLFEFEVDYQYEEIRAAVKYSVVLGALGAYMLYRYKKNLPAPTINNLRAEISHIGDVGKLDKYLKRV